MTTVISKLLFLNFNIIVTTRKVAVYMQNAFRSPQKRHMTASNLSA